MNATAKTNKFASNGKDATLDNNSTATVFVGCKLPHGLILELAVGTPEHRHVKLKGGRTELILGAGITRVPKDFIDRWMKANKDKEFVKRGQIWIAETEDACRAGALHLHGMDTGLEPLSGGQIPKDIEADTEHLAKMGVAVRGL